MKVCKLKIITFKIDKYPLQRRTYFLTFVESLEMIFSQYKETCEVLLDYPKIGGENKKEIEKRLFVNFHANIDVLIIRLIADFPAYGIKCIEKLQSHCAKITFADNIRYDRIFHQVTHKWGE